MRSKPNFMYYLVEMIVEKKTEQNKKYNLPSHKNNTLNLI